MAAAPTILNRKPISEQMSSDIGSSVAPAAHISAPRNCSTAAAVDGDIQDVMQFYDTVGDGRISVSQIGTCLSALGLVPTQKALAEVTQKWEGKDVRITLEELTPIYRSLKKTFVEKSPEALTQCLDAFDRDGSGNISVHELRWLLTTVGEKMTTKEADMLLQGREDGQDGRININDFIRHITS